MINLEFSEEKKIIYNWCGKFQSPTNEWMHLTRDLIDYELILVTEGTLYIADSKKEYAIEKGEYLIMTPDQFQHGYKKSDCTFYWLHFDMDSDTKKVSSSISFPLHDRLAYPERIIVLMKQLQDSDKNYHNDLLNNSLASALIAEIYCQSAAYKKYNSTKQTKQIFNDIVDFIHYHASENVKVWDIAEYFGYNEKYLSTFFKKQAGIPLKQFILNVKMDTAKAQLSDTNHSISQIAYNVGFNDPHNFSNAFKKITGLSPSEYRISYGKRSLFYK